VSTLRVIRKIVRDRDSARYVRIVACALLGKFGDQADIERLDSEHSPGEVLVLVHVLHEHPAYLWLSQTRTRNGGRVCSKSEIQSFAALLR
jgi:hypothetical protein